MQLLSTDYELEKVNVDDEESQVQISNKRIRRSRYEEPETHKNNFTLLEKIFKCCLGSKAKTKLTPSELSCFYSLKEEANKTFSAKSADYVQLLKKLWNLLTDKELGENLESKQWKDYGFQNANPRSDFRGAGVLALLHMIYFLQKHKSYVPRMCSDKSDFFFAITSINITYFLKLYYHLSDSLDPVKDKKIFCSRVAFKSFCKCQELDDSFLDKVHSMLLIDIFEIWIQIRKQVKGVNILDFSMAEESVKKRYRLATQNSIFLNYKDLKQHYQNVKISQPKDRPSMSHKRK